MSFLEVDDLKVTFTTEDGVVRAVDGLSFAVEQGRTLGIVGESGSGKSVTSLAVMGLHRTSHADVTGRIVLDGQDLVAADPDVVRRLRGRRMAMIFQDPLTSLHPFYTVGWQIDEAYHVHHPKAGRREARTRTVEMLRRVGIPQPDQRADDYPHQFSGGMRQRVMIAMALVNDPDLLIADEPTTALDVTVQAQILDLIRDLQQEFGSAVIIITHDLGVVAELADDVLVMYAGKCVENGPARAVFDSPQHPYTWGLLGSVPRMDREIQDRLMPIAGAPPSLIRLPRGCAFHPRCPFARLNGTRSYEDVPELRDTGQPDHRVACHLDAETRARLFREEVAPKL
ncbi:ABC transporter ATP-binding protein [Uniformispora flossi]|uniref:ABC transporter ATP-binding protein n=1 Tax=Yinghuangia aomiensis TaxID=676205 RepID=A0ABP9HDD7_9ACTN